MSPLFYHIEWHGDRRNRPDGSPTMVRLYVCPVVGAHVLVPFLGEYRRCLVHEVTPCGVLCEKADPMYDYAADLVLSLATT